MAVLTGAGISTDSGIPDYRGPDGVWTRDPAKEAMFRIETFLADRTARERFWLTYAGHAAWSAQPNAAHRALADLERRVGGMRVLTQNIDGLHQKAGSTERKVLELHGSMRQVVCVKCKRRTPSAETIARVDAGETDPRCLTCGGILKLGVVLFGENLDPTVLDQAVRVARSCQVMLAIGTTLQVEPVASLCALAVQAGAKLVVVNRDPTPYDALATEVVREPIGTAVPRLTGLFATTSRSAAGTP
ncbi:NAD-dependent protein deacetylase 2 [Virgisporangium aliadipatigenens]|uniref:protein acetyllysine N-acetyltransferase n=1 Tax=Virgisporangium aliadipatigenens TaxID=741659 RepID=A0A8J4DNX8_9ACTN|nr:Sir2 family NAD-dependent protein deacetylase [Virgisporangium aliadipatigenens]GIJ44919.1 NAD-dependent protein deacetylase 2 [Virgisporangium aliadipatigenens]